MRTRALPAYGLPADTPLRVAKVRTGGGKSGGGKTSALPPAVRRRLEECWQETMAPATGCASYDELRAAMGSSASAAGR